MGFEKKHRPNLALMLVQRLRHSPNIKTALAQRRVCVTRICWRGFMGLLQTPPVNCLDQISLLYTDTCRREKSQQMFSREDKLICRAPRAHIGTPTPTPFVNKVSASVLSVFSIHRDPFSAGAIKMFSHSTFHAFSPNFRDKFTRIGATMGRTQTRDIEPLLVQSWASVVHAGPTMAQWLVFIGE